MTISESLHPSNRQLVDVHIQETEEEEEDLLKFRWRGREEWSLLNHVVYSKQPEAAERL